MVVLVVINGDLRAATAGISPAAMVGVLYILSSVVNVM
jgi:hypothetical protein